MKTIVVMTLFLMVMYGLSALVGTAVTHLLKFKNIKLTFIYGFITLVAIFWLITMPLGYLHYSIQTVMIWATIGEFVVIIVAAIYIFKQQCQLKVMLSSQWFLILTIVVVISIWFILQINYYGLNINNNFSIDNEVYRNIVVDNYYAQQLYSVNPRNGFPKATELAYLITSSLLLPAYLAKMFCVSPVAMWETYYPCWLIIFMISLIYESLQFYVDNKQLKQYVVAGLLFLSGFTWYLPTFYNAEINKFFVEPAYPTTSTIFYPILVTLLLVQQIKNNNIWTITLPTLVCAITALAFHSVTLVCFMILFSIAMIVYQITVWQSLTKKQVIIGLVASIIVLISIIGISYVMNGARVLRWVPQATNFEYPLYLNYMRSFLIPFLLLSLFIFKSLNRQQKLFLVIYPVLVIILLTLPGTRELLFNALLFGGRRLGDSIVTFTFIVLIGIYIPMIIQSLPYRREYIIGGLIILSGILLSNRATTVINQHFNIGLNRLTQPDNTYHLYYRLLDILEKDARQQHRELTLFAPRMMNIYYPPYKKNKAQTQAEYFQLSFLRSFNPKIKIFEQGFENAPNIEIETNDIPVYNQAGVCFFYNNVGKAPWRTPIVEVQQINQCHLPMFRDQFKQLTQHYNINYLIVSKNDDTYDWYLDNLTLVTELKDDKLKDILNIYRINK